ncbi:MAG: hypothetical protein ACR2P0_02140 [Acidimicrobiales bacterium]
MDLALFDQIAELVRAMSPDDLGDVRVRAHRRGVKVWFETEHAGKEHFEAQQLARHHVDGVAGMAIEIGFHAEHPDAARNQKVLERVEQSEKTWRNVLGAEAEAAEFFGAANWRRVSEAWIEPDLDDPELAFEVASRLVDYITVIEPARR